MQPRTELSAIVVPAGTPGLEVHPPYRKMGWHASDTHGLTFADCRVPEDHLLGGRGRGFAQFLEVLDEGRVAIAALSVGVIQACLEHAVRHAEPAGGVRPRDRHEPGHGSFKCADLEVMVSAARALTYEAAGRIDLGLPFKTQAAVAKLYASEAAVDRDA